MPWLRNNWIFDKCDTLDIFPRILLGLGKQFQNKSFKLVIFPNRSLTDRRYSPTHDLLIWDLNFFVINLLHQQSSISLRLTIILWIICYKIQMFLLREHERHRGHLPTTKIYSLQIYFFVLTSIILF